MRFSPSLEVLAKEKGLTLLKITLHGKYAKKGSVVQECAIGPETAKKVMELMSELSDPKKRLW